MKVKITIDWDSETREALVQINDRPTARRWKDADLSVLKRLEPEVVDGFEVPADPYCQSIILKGTVK